MTKKLLITGSILAGLSVALGALGAHWLKENISAAAVTGFQTGVHYQMVHALTMLVMAALPIRYQNNLFRYAYYAFLTGTILFSGSIYLLSTRGISGWEWPWLGPITPLGGILFITGWILMIFSAFRINDRAEG